ncbi:MAG: glycosyltransferase [Propylenella sp.]
MPRDHLDIVFVSDARFPGGTSTALATEILAAADAGFRAGLLHVRGPVLGRPHPFNPQLRGAIDSGKVAWLDPRQRLDCELLVVYHPMLFPMPLAERIEIRPREAVIVAQHPPLDGEGEPQYDIIQQVRSVETSFGCRPAVAPVGPNCRSGFASVPLDDVQLVAEDWHNLIDLRRWPMRPNTPFSNPIVIGRHTRPDALKWPDTRAEMLAAYPDDARFKVRVLGAGPFLREKLGSVPANWELLPFGAMDPSGFLASLDAYVYFHSARWVEAFGCSVLEALATGLVTILPASFRPLFGDAALYGEPRDVTGILLSLRDSEETALHQAAKARAMAEDFFSSDRFPDRVERLFGLRPRKNTEPAGASALTIGRGERTVLFISSNGVGLGHLTREIAIAKRLMPGLRPVFFTLSRAAALVREAGYLVEHTMFHRYANVEPAVWNPALAEELFEALLFHHPAVCVFDGNAPYEGMLAAIEAYGRAPSVWIRRAMWREGHLPMLRRTRRFDAVVEPGEIAGEDDFGPTRADRANVRAVAPILLLRPEDRLPRMAARRRLGAANDRLLVAMQLGSGTNFELGPARRALLEALLGHGNVDVVEFASLIVNPSEARESFGASHRIVSAFPSYRLSNAFDFAVSGAGYNSFHEYVLGAVPAVFVPNEAAEMDRQDVRARYADRNGLGRSLRAFDVYGAEEAIAEMLDANVRAAIKARCAEIKVADGAAEAARFIEEMVYSIRPMQASA